MTGGTYMMLIIYYVNEVKTLMLTPAALHTSVNLLESPWHKTGHWVVDDPQSSRSVFMYVIRA